MAANKTPAAAKSFTFLIDSLRSLETKSASVSMEVFIASDVKTNPITMITANHSVAEMEKIKPNNTDKTAIIK